MIRRIVLNQEFCAAHECCVLACPEVFNIDSGLIELHDGAERFFASHVEQILTAAYLCPVNAIVVETDDPPSLLSE